MSGKDMTARAVESVSMSARVLRCGCGNPDAHAGRVCPTPRATEDYGVVSYWSSSRMKRWAFALRKRLDRRPHGTAQPR